MRLIANGMLMTLAVALSACASSRHTVDEAAVDDFVAVRGLEPADSIRTDSGDRWTQLNDRYLVYEARDGEYLLRFARDCWELRDNIVVADKRWESNRIRARFDTLRGCRIAEIFALTENDAIEVRELGKPPGSGN